MKKFIKRTLPVLILIIALGLPAVVQAAGLSNFTYVKSYPKGLFKDVPSGSWYEEYVVEGYRLGLINGSDTNTFSPDRVMTLAESIKLAACLHKTYYTGQADFDAGSPWYIPYVNYCIQNEILEKTYSDYTAVCTRAEFASIFANALPTVALPEINTVPNNTIPDVRLSESFGPSVYMLYRAGILTGSDEKGTFNPKSNIHRTEMATIVARMADLSLRKSDGTVEVPIEPPVDDPDTTAKPSPSPTSSPYPDPSPSPDMIEDNERDIAIATLEKMDSLRPHILNNNIISSSKNKEALRINEQIRSRGIALIDFRDNQYVALGDIAVESADLAESFEGKTASYMSQTGLKLWTELVDEYRSVLATVIDVAG